MEVEVMEVDLLASPVGIFPFLLRHPGGPGAGWRKIRGVLLAPVPGWDDLDLSATGGGSRVLAQLREAPSRLARGEISRCGFGSPQANLAARGRALAAAVWVWEPGSGLRSGGTIW